MTYTHLSQPERYQIQALMKAGQTQIKIARNLGAINLPLFDS
jgi:IS30 family transposase